MGKSGKNKEKSKAHLELPGRKNGKTLPVVSRESILPLESRLQLEKGEEGSDSAAKNQSPTGESLFQKGPTGQKRKKGTTRGQK